MVTVSTNRLLSNAMRCGDRSRCAGQSVATTVRTPLGTASAAPGSRRGSRMCFFCKGCAVSASSRSFKRDSPGLSRRLSTPGVGRIRLAAGPPSRPDFPCMRPFGVARRLRAALASSQFQPDVRADSPATGQSARVRLTSTSPPFRNFRPGSEKMKVSSVPDASNGKGVPSRYRM